jgi:hypothetical protein
MATTTATEHIIDLARHAGQEAPDAPIPKPQLGGNFEVDKTVLKGMWGRISPIGVEFQLTIALEQLYQCLELKWSLLSTMECRFGVALQR